MMREVNQNYYFESLLLFSTVSEMHLFNYYNF